MVRNFGVNSSVKSLSFFSFFSFSLINKSYHLIIDFYKRLLHVISMKFHHLVFFLSLICLIGFVSSVPPQTEVQNFPEGYSIEVHPIKQYFKAGEDVTFHAHVFNSSNGVPINESITCYFHMYKGNGEHVVTITQDTPDDLHDYEFFVAGGNLTKEVSSYHAYCVNGDIGGDYPFAIEVNESGLSNNPSFYFLILILSFGVIGVGFYIGDAPFVILGSLGLYFVGFYILFYGINGIKDQVYTWALGLITLGLAFYISAKSSAELLN